MGEQQTETLTTRWAGVLARLAEGPADYGPHDTEQVCAALERVCDERDRLRRVLAGETGDADTIGGGWLCDLVGDWIHPERGVQVERVRNWPPQWRAFYRGRWTDHDTAVAGMDVAMAATATPEEAPHG